MSDNSDRKVENINSASRQSLPSRPIVIQQAAGNPHIPSSINNPIQELTATQFIHRSSPVPVHRRASPSNPSHRVSPSSRQNYRPSSSPSAPHTAYSSQRTAQLAGRVSPAPVITRTSATYSGFRVSPVPPLYTSPLTSNTPPTYTGQKAQRVSQNLQTSHTSRKSPSPHSVLHRVSPASLCHRSSPDTDKQIPEPSNPLQLGSLRQRLSSSRSVPVVVVSGLTSVTPSYPAPDMPVLQKPSADGPSHGNSGHSAGPPPLQQMQSVPPMLSAAPAPTMILTGPRGVTFSNPVFGRLERNLPHSQPGMSISQRPASADTATTSSSRGSLTTASQALLEMLRKRSDSSVLPPSVSQFTPLPPHQLQYSAAHMHATPNQQPVLPDPPHLQIAPSLLSQKPTAEVVGQVPQAAAAAAVPFSDSIMPRLFPENVEASKENAVNREDSKVKEETSCKKPDESPYANWEKIPNPFNMRVVNLSNFPVAQTTYRATYRSHTLAIQRAKLGSITSTAKSLDLLRQNLQKSINKEIDEVIQKYLDSFFKPGIENIKSNNGENAVSDDMVFTVCRQILEEAKKMYVSETRSVTPDILDNVSESGSIKESKIVREKKHSFFNIRKRKGSEDSSSEASQPVVRKKKKGRPPLHGGSGRSTPSKMGKPEPVKREGPKWDSERIKSDSLFVMGARANKALGLGATRGRLYIKHPEVFKYSGDQDDKQWLYENQLMPATGGKAYMLLVEDVKELAQTDEYRNSPGLALDEIIGFTVPEKMIEKMKAQMKALRTDAPKTKHQGRPPAAGNDGSRHKKQSPLLAEADENTDSDHTLPFSKLQSPIKPADDKSDLIIQNSPTSLLSTEDQDDHSVNVSPFNMTGGFDEGFSPAPSDLDALEDEAPQSAPFEFTS